MPKHPVTSKYNPKNKTICETRVVRISDLGMRAFTWGRVGVNRIVSEMAAFMAEELPGEGWRLASRESYAWFFTRTRPATPQEILQYRRQEERKKKEKAESLRKKAERETREKTKKETREKAQLKALLEKYGPLSG